MKKHWLGGGVAGVLALAGLAFIQAQDAQRAAAPGGAVAFVASQPIAFPHNTHAGTEPGQMGMDCQYCHFSAERSVDAGLPDTEAVFWYLILKLDLARLAVDKDRFVAALAAEGLPVRANYLHLFTRASWYRNRAVFGKSGYPWTCPLYKGDPDREYPMSNVFAAHDTIFMMDLHESMTDKEVEDTMTILKKVEAAYLK